MLTHALPGITAGAPPPAGLRIRTSRITGHATFVASDNLGGIPVKAGAAAVAGPGHFLLQHGHLFGIKNPARQLAPGRHRRDRLGHARTTYQQVHEGVPVFAGVLHVHQDAAGRFRAANGHFFPAAAKVANTTATFPAAQAERVARKLLNQPGAILEKCELVIVDPGWYGDPPIGPHLAWHIILNHTPAAVREAFFIDAHAGHLLDRWNMIHTARSRQIYDAEGGWTLPGTLARAEGEPPVSVDDINRAYDYAGDTYDYFFRAFGRDSLDDEGLPLVITVNSNFRPCPNAFWNGSQLIFCSGMVCDDILAHEFTHGLTEYTANLIYQNQCGQLNESFSDIFGELVDLFNGDPAWPTHPSGSGTDTPNTLRSGCSTKTHGYPDGYRWLIGEDTISDALRDMWSPTCFLHPDRGYSSYQTCPEIDSGGVHSGSGIPNHAFAIMTDGKVFNGYTVNGIGPIKAGAVWYRALTTYLTPGSDFEDAYAALNQSAQDLIGTYPNDPRTGLPSDSIFNSQDAEQVDKALLAVEMDGPGSCGAIVPILNSTPPTLCGPDRHIVFSDDFENGPNGWTVSNTNPPTPYDWVQTTTALPFGRPGIAWFCEDRNIGDCISVSEAGSHSLISPVIQIPPYPLNPTAMFTHYLAAEPQYDGGNIKISVNGGAWVLVPQNAISYNTYNSLIYPTSVGNPLANQPAWTGAGGEWGTSVIPLGSFVSGGETIQFRFEFGKDGCNGVTGWYIDDFVVFTCPGTPPVAEDGNVRTPVGTPIDIVLSAQDDGHPVPPGKLAYAITQLPTKGSLEDPGAGPITQVPHTLANDGREVTYTPADRFYEGPDTFTFKASDGGTPPEGGDSNTATVTVQIGPIEYFTEQFTGAAGDEFDLEGRSLTLRPQAGLPGYVACTVPIAELPVDPAGHTVLPLDDDGYQQISLTGGHSVWLYDQPYESLYVCGNGFVVPGEVDEPSELAGSTESPFIHFSTRRIAGLFDDLNPAAGGQILFAELSDRAVATWLNVPKYASAHLNTFQIELFFDGTIRMSWTLVQTPDSLVGLSNGNGVPPDYLESNLTRFRRCPPDFDLDGDVDLTDFGHLQSCLTGIYPNLNPACMDANIDEDPNNRIDSVDVQKFVRCLTGPAQLADLSCLP